MITIFTSGIVCDTRLIVSRVWPTANILRAVITCTGLIGEIDVDIRDVDNLNWGVSAGIWTGSIRFGGQGDVVCFDRGILAEPEEGEAEDGRSPGSNGHFTKVVGEDRTFKCNCTSANVVVLDALHLSAPCRVWCAQRDTLTARIQTSVMTSTNSVLPAAARALRTTKSAC